MKKLYALFLFLFILYSSQAIAANWETGGLNIGISYKVNSVDRTNKKIYLDYKYDKKFIPNAVKTKYPQVTHQIISAEFDCQKRMLNASNIKYYANTTLLDSVDARVSEPNPSVTPMCNMYKL